MIQITISGTASKQLKAAVAETIQNALETRKHVCVLSPLLQADVESVTENDHKQARGQDIFLCKEERPRAYKFMKGD